MQKTFFIFLAMAGICCASLFSQTGYYRSWLYFDNDKLNITEYLMNEDVRGNGTWICKNRFPTITNKTNNEMEVTVNYKLSFLDGKTYKSDQKQIYNHTITIRPHGSESILAKVEILNHKDLLYEFPTLSTLDSAHVSNFELVHYRIIKKDYEIP